MVADVPNTTENFCRHVAPRLQRSFTRQMRAVETGLGHKLPTEWFTEDVHP